MFTFNLDDATATLVCCYTTPYDKADYAGYHTAFSRLVSAARTRHRPAVLLIDIQDGYPQPNAVQRKEIGEAWAKAPDVEAAIAIITTSALIRGIITAIEWFFKNAMSRRETRAFAKTEDAAAWLCESGKVEAIQLDALLERLRTRKQTTDNPPV
jgi:hypothetical protein